jgi:hypothetical protein
MKFGPTAIFLCGLKTALGALQGVLEIEPTDCSTLSLICVHQRSSAARYAFPLAQRENSENRYGPLMNADERG